MCILQWKCAVQHGSLPTTHVNWGVSSVEEETGESNVMSSNPALDNHTRIHTHWWLFHGISFSQQRVLYRTEAVMLRALRKKYPKGSRLLWVCGDDVLLGSATCVAPTIWASTIFVLKRLCMPSKIMSIWLISYSSLVFQSWDAVRFCLQCFVWWGPAAPCCIKVWLDLQRERPGDACRVGRPHCPEEAAQGVGWKSNNG